MRAWALALLLPAVLIADGSDSQPDQLPKIIVGSPHPSRHSAKQLEADAAAGNPKAEYELAHDLELGIAGFHRDFTRALNVYAKAGADGDTDGYFRLGMIYDDAIGVDQDSPKALEYFKAAGSRGDAEGQYNAGTLLVSARGGIKRDWVEGLAWLILAKKNGAAGTGEKQVRDHLAGRPQLIAQAETRAVEIAKNRTPIAPPDNPAPAEVRPDVPSPTLEVPPTHIGPPGS